MPTASGGSATSSFDPSPPPIRRRWMTWTMALIVVWAASAYLLIPEAWYRHARRHPALDDVATITHTADGIPGDPLNIAAVATAREFRLLMLAAKWYPADPLTLKSCLEIAEATMLKRPYDDAPMSNLYLSDRKQDLAFEKPVGNDPRQRHHVRFWKSDRLDEAGRPLWIGSATYDRAVGLSHTTGQITHHIAASVDDERDGLIADWQAASRGIEIYLVTDFQKTREGRNGGGDPWHTDGTLKVAVITQQ